MKNEAQMDQTSIQNVKKKNWKSASRKICRKCIPKKFVQTPGPPWRVPCGNS